MTALRLPATIGWATAAGGVPCRRLAAREAPAVWVHFAAGVRDDWWLDRISARVTEAAIRVHSATVVQGHRSGTRGRRGTATVRVHPTAVVRSRTNVQKVSQCAPNLLQESEAGGLLAGRGRGGRGPGDGQSGGDGKSGDFAPESGKRHGYSFRRGGSRKRPSVALRAPLQGVWCLGESEKADFFLSGGTR
jgi:hypothetical protein